jgi:hypothetical protein
MSRRLFRRLIPHPDSLARHRALAWLAPLVRDPRLWRLSCRGVALGVAIGVFFGFLIPIGQIPLAAILAFVLRANVGAAAASTLVSNPLTFPPIYLAAYQIGAWLLAVPVEPAELREVEQAAEALAEARPTWWERMSGIGAALAVGLALMALTGSLAAYFTVTLLWRAAVWLRMRRRARRSRRGRSQ